jgi:nicotinamide mononucleotide transporter
MDTLLHALQPLLAPAFTLWGSPTSWLELIASVLALVMVGLNMRVNPLAWPLALTSSLMYCWLFAQSRLYGEASLQVVFAVLACWGWWQWLRGTTSDGHTLHVRHLPSTLRWQLLAVMAVGWPALALFLARCTDSDVPWWDAFPTMASLIGQWLLGRKYVESWPTWLVVNAVSVGLFAHKDLRFVALLYALFAALSVLGWLAWRRLALQRLP